MFEVIGLILLVLAVIACIFIFVCLFMLPNVIPQGGSRGITEQNPPPPEPPKEDEKLYKILKHNVYIGEISQHITYEFFGFVKLADSEVEGAKEVMGNFFKLEAV